MGEPKTWRRRFRRRKATVGLTLAVLVAAAAASVLAGGGDGDSAVAGNVPERLTFELLDCRPSPDGQYAAIEENFDSAPPPPEGVVTVPLPETVSAEAALAHYETLTDRPLSAADLLLRGESGPLRDYEQRRGERVVRIVRVTQNTAGQWAPTAAVVCAEEGR